MAGSTQFPYETKLWIVFGTCVLTIIICGLGIVYFLMAIELQKVIGLLVSTDDEDEKTGSSKNGGGKSDMVEDGGLEFTVEDSYGKVQNPSTSPSSTKKQKPVRRMKNNLPWSFLGMQIVSVSVLVVLMYLLLVVTSSASIYLRGIASLFVLGMYLRYPLGEELRRQRMDRIVAIVTLFVLIAGALSILTYAQKQIAQGEIYQGPARIVGYDYSQYTNSEEDTTTRIDIMVSWGKSWGCPESNNRVCQAHVQGALCQNNDEDADENYGDRRHDRRRVTKQRNLLLPDDSNNDANDAEDNAELEQQNKDLEKKNEELEAELEQLEGEVKDEKDEENKVEDELDAAEKDEKETTEELDEYKDYTDELEDELVSEEEAAEANSEFDEVIIEEDEKGDIVEEEEVVYEDGELVEDVDYDYHDESYQEEEIAEYEEDEEIVNQEYDSYEDEITDDAYIEELEEYKEEYDEEVDQEIDELEVDIEEEEAEKQGYGEGDDYYEYIESEEEGEEVENYGSDDAVPYYYDDDIYDSEYWGYDWDSVWGDYSCYDMFENDMQNKNLDDTEPPGADSEDDWPYINIYGSCKTCEAYILDYFAEEAFEQIDHYKTQGIVYVLIAFGGLFVYLFAYLEHLANPTNDNEIELLPNDGGAMA